MNINTLYKNRRTVWYSLLFISTFLELTALYYQYILDFPPCVICIHVRLWVAVIWLLSLIGLAIPASKALRATLLTSVLLCFSALIERSWQLLGTERGFIFGSCNFDIGLPNWLAVDKWLPFLFKVETSCGYTPTIIAGVTMAEALLVLSSVLWLYLFVLLFYTFKKSALTHR
jgi:disulfide bond formation protein DsbB